jgi:hypothetical protein
MPFVQLTAILFAMQGDYPGLTTLNRHAYRPASKVAVRAVVTRGDFKPWATRSVCWS